MSCEIIQYEIILYRNLITMKPGQENMDLTFENKNKKEKKEKLNIFMIFWLLFLKKRSVPKA